MSGTKCSTRSGTALGPCRAHATVSVIATATNTVSATIPLGGAAIGIAVTPDGSKVYVANEGSNNNNVSNDVSVIDTATNTVVATINVGSLPIAFGNFIQPPKPFAGAPGSPNCTGGSIAALAQKYGSLAAAAQALGETVPALRRSVTTFCSS